MAHGMASGKERKQHPVYTAWCRMKSRCFNAVTKEYPDYGGRGITVCERWMKFENFRDDLLSDWQEGLSLDRIDVNGNYEPSNCRWATRSVQNKNKRKKATIQSRFPGVTWEYNKWRFTVLGFSHSEEEAARLHDKLKDYLKSLQ